MNTYNIKSLESENSVFKNNFNKIALSVGCSVMVSGSMLTFSEYLEFEQKYFDQQSENQGVVDVLKKEINFLKENTDREKGVLSSLFEEKSKLEGAYENLKNDYDSFKGGHSVVLGKMLDLETEVKKFKEKHVKLEENNANLKQSCDDLSQKYNNLTQDYDDLVQEIDVLETRINDFVNVKSGVFELVVPEGVVLSDRTYRLVFRLEQIKNIYEVLFVKGAEQQDYKAVLNNNFNDVKELIEKIDIKVDPAKSSVDFLFKQIEGAISGDIASLVAFKKLYDGATNR